MTLQYEPPGVWRAICDSCGDDTVLDDTDEDDRAGAEQELRDRGWDIGPPEQVNFSGGLESTRYSEQFENHSCPDCAEMIPTAPEKYRKDKGREFGK